MHELAGLTWGEWVSIIGIITFIASLISLLFKLIFASFQRDIQELNKNFKALNGTLDFMKSEVRRLDEKDHQQDILINRHEERFKTLFKKENK